MCGVITAILSLPCEVRSSANIAFLAPGYIGACDSWPPWQLNQTWTLTAKLDLSYHSRGGQALRTGRVLAAATHTRSARLPLFPLHNRVQRGRLKGNLSTLLLPGKVELNRVTSQGRLSDGSEQALQNFF